MKLKKHIISFNGDHGSGKSTIAKKLAKKLGYKRFYMGKIARSMAEEHKMSYARFLELLKKDSSYDKKIDNYVIDLGNKKNNFIIESRTAWHFIPQSFKIYLQVDPMEGARRMFADYQNDSHRDNESRGIKTIKDILVISKNRKEADDKRYKKLYNINANDMSQYDLVVDTTALTREEVLEIIKDAYEKAIS
jgi:cytidylate kinase